MISKSQIQYIRSLHQKKFREKNREFIVEGPKLVDELLKSRFEVKRIYAVSGESDWLERGHDRGIESIETGQAELSRISALKTPNSVLAIAGMPDLDADDFVMPDDFVMMLDGISDPGNLGTIIRTSDWFGIHTLVCSPDTVEVFNPKVVQATMGSVFRCRVFYTDVRSFLSNLNSGVTVYGTFLEGSNIYAENFSSPGILVIGSESHGIRPDVEKFITKKIHIPSLSGGAESLNASVAAAIACSEIRRNVIKKI